MEITLSQRLGMFGIVVSLGLILKWSNSCSAGDFLIQT